VWGDACGGLLCALAAAAAATAATVVHSGCLLLRRLLLDRQVFRPGHSGRPAVNPPAFFASHLFVYQRLKPFERAAVPVLKPGPPGQILFQPGPPGHPLAGHNWRHVVLPFLSNWLVFGGTSRRRFQWAPVGASWLSCVKQQLALRTAPSCYGGKRDHGAVCSPFLSSFHLALQAIFLPT
jgi:hypothetical protein